MSRMPTSRHILCDSHSVYILRGCLQVFEVVPFLLTEEIGWTAGVTSHPQPLSIDTASEVADDVLELFKGLRFELH